jgi:hypothetical protein
MATKVARNKERKKKCIIMNIIKVAYFHGSLSHKFINILHYFTKSTIRQTWFPWAEAVVESLAWAAAASQESGGPLA